MATLKAKQDEAKKAEAKARLEAEKKINEVKAKALAEKKAAEAAEKLLLKHLQKKLPQLRLKKLLQQKLLLNNFQQIPNKKLGKAINPLRSAGGDFLLLYAIKHIKLFIPFRIKCLSLHQHSSAQYYLFSNMKRTDKRQHSDNRQARLRN